MLYAGDQILMATSKNELQTMAYHLNPIPGKYNINVSSTQTNGQCVGTTHKE
jgi:hypothetical protein